MNSKILNASKALFVMMFSGSLFLLGCKGDDGAIGPKGKDGNANVLYSDWELAKSFNDSIVDNSNIKVGHIKAPLLTDSVLQHGVVFMYMTYGAGPMQLPYTSYAGGKPNTISFWTKIGKLIPYRFTHDNTNSVNLSSALQYRYIIIPADTPVDSVSNGRVASKKDPDYSNYEEVCKYYGIPL